MLTDLDADGTIPRMRVVGLKSDMTKRSLNSDLKVRPMQQLRRLRKERIGRPKFNPLRANDEGWITTHRWGTHCFPLHESTIVMNLRIAISRQPSSKSQDAFKGRESLDPTCSALVGSQSLT
jgi:hypothetical protein